MQAATFKRLTVLGLTVLSVAVGSGIAASSTSAQVEAQIVRQSNHGVLYVRPSPTPARVADVFTQYDRRLVAPRTPTSVPLVPAGSSGNSGQTAGGVRPAVGNPTGSGFEIIEEVLWIRNNFLGFGSQGKLGALGCSISTDRRHQQLNAVASRYEYRNQTGVAETESCTAWFTVRR